MTLPIWPLYSSFPSPLSPEPTLLETTVRSFTTSFRLDKASMRVSWHRLYVRPAVLSTIRQERHGTHQVSHTIRTLHRNNTFVTLQYSHSRNGTHLRSARCLPTSHPGSPRRPSPTPSSCSVRPRPRWHWCCTRSVGDPDHAAVLQPGSRPEEHERWTFRPRSVLDIPAGGPATGLPAPHTLSVRCSASPNRLEVELLLFESVYVPTSRHRNDPSAAGGSRESARASSRWCVWSRLRLR